MESYINRLKIFTTIIILVAIILVFGLFQKQVLQRGKYLALAKKQYTVVKEVVPDRGEIFISDYQDGEFTAAAINLHFYDLLIIPKNITDPKEASKKLANLIGMSEKEIYDQINNDKPYIPPIKKKLDSETAKKIEGLNLSGVMLVPNMWRYYPENNLACFILGFVDSSNVGRYGVEGYYNQELKGETEEINIEKNNNLPYYSLINREKTTNGSDIYLTIDRNIQFMAEKILKDGIEKNKAESGSITIMEPKTGKILAMASFPNFNPNNFFEEKSVDIFNNPNIAYSYEPGSVYKVISMAAALDSGKVTPETEGVFGSSVKVGIETIRTSTGKAYGRENMAQILQNSDNVGMVWVAQQMGEEIYYKYIKDWGFGEKTQIDLDSETEGSIMDLKKWRPINLATASFGQGIAVTPIQLITAISSIANEGNLMQPYIVNKIVEKSGKEIKKDPKKIRQVIKKESAQSLTDMMISVVEKGHGKKAGVKGYWVAGKTGTAQIPDPNKSGYLEGVNIGSFAGFAPAHNPKFAILVKIDRPKNVVWAEDSAAPIFGEIAEWLLNYLQVPKER